MPYASIDEEELAQLLGFTMIRSKQVGDRFRRKNRYIWGVHNGWQTADLVKSQYTNHQKYRSLKDALWRE